MKPLFTFPLSFNILIDGVVRSSHSVRNEFERQEVIDANLRVYGSDHVQVLDDLVSNRRIRILNDVVARLTEHYPFLADEALAMSFCETLPIIPADKEWSGEEWAEGMIEMLCNRWDRAQERVEKEKGPNPNDPDGLWPLEIDLSPDLEQ